MRELNARSCPKLQMLIGRVLGRDTVGRGGGGGGGGAGGGGGGGGGG